MNVLQLKNPTTKSFLLCDNNVSNWENLGTPAARSIANSDECVSNNVSWLTVSYKANNVAYCYVLLTATDNAWHALADSRVCFQWLLRMYLTLLLVPTAAVGQSWYVIGGQNAAISAGPTNRSVSYPFPGLEGTIGHHDSIFRTVSESCICWGRLYPTPTKTSLT